MSKNLFVAISGLAISCLFLSFYLVSQWDAPGPTEWVHRLIWLKFWVGSSACGIAGVLLWRREAGAFLATLVMASGAVQGSMFELNAFQLYSIGGLVGQWLICFMGLAAGGVYMILWTFLILREGAAAEEVAKEEVEENPVEQAEPTVATT